MQAEAHYSTPAACVPQPDIPTTHQPFSTNVSISLLQSTRFSTPKHDTPYYTDGSIVLHVAFLFSPTGVKGRGGKIFFAVGLHYIYMSIYPYSLTWSLFVWGLELSCSTARQYKTSMSLLDWTEMDLTGIFACAPCEVTVGRLVAPSRE